MESQARKEGAADLIIAKLNEGLTTVDEVLHVGSNLNERVPAMVLGPDNQKIVAGLTNSKKFPVGTTVATWQREGKYRLFLMYITDNAPFNLQ